MIIDDFMSKKVGEQKLEKKVPNISDPIGTSTPRASGTRQFVWKLGKVPENFASPSLDVSATERVLSSVPEKAVFQAPVPEDLSMQSINGTLEDTYDRMCK
jgi:hypothetical protein